MTTTSTKADAEMIAKALLEQSLAACVQIDGPIQSHYRWKGEIHCDEEHRLMIKTTMEAWPRLRQCIAEIHPYDEPELIMIEVIDSSEGYLDWVIQQTEIR
ncbi:MAG: divalent-cation tolerance protein CutA [Pirellulaceae bacterium]